MVVVSVSKILKTLISWKIVDKYDRCVRLQLRSRWGFRVSENFNVTAAIVIADRNLKRLLYVSHNCMYCFGGWDLVCVCVCACLCLFPFSLSKKSVSHHHRFRVIVIENSPPFYSVQRDDNEARVHTLISITTTRYYLRYH